MVMKMSTNNPSQKSLVLESSIKPSLGKYLHKHCRKDTRRSNIHWLRWRCI